MLFRFSFVDYVNLRKNIIISYNFVCKTVFTIHNSHQYLTIIHTKNTV